MYNYKYNTITIIHVVSFIITCTVYTILILFFHFSVPHLFMILFVIMCPMTHFSSFTPFPILLNLNMFIISSVFSHIILCILPYYYILCILPCLLYPLHSPILLYPLYSPIFPFSTPFLNHSVLFVMMLMSKSVFH